MNLPPTDRAGAPGGSPHDAADDTALLASILALALPPGADPADAARALLARFGTIGAVFAADPAELASAVAGRLQIRVIVPLLREAAIRLMRARIRQGDLLSCHDALMAYLQASLARDTVEQFRVLFLDRGTRLIADEVLAQGTIDQTPVYPREVMRRAIQLKASELILVHNHPGWNPTPSREDIAMTRRLAQIATVLGLTVRDHVIVGNGASISFRQAGLL
ncbi:DNA repair protein RadC [Gluconacetobacter diazotrophicus PA1 5]|uniref:DNA repair protein RadC n=2 Tax=Gluconacetobacter diazotrophicus TaxID=33996 RepID=A0A7W4NGI1_GLUDI|nr:DNA repair protein RadC [Gluconacetobacter diazotrophicus]ACI50005.1 DNA repair protein RadC [Gluconacetobacter diazotrophicus PA1 5]MBB2157331.1 DNA repair protein RadC [Gluconacetobacter diazotrophicus]TWB07915.1 DNA repair protein RadC [Gluconacetobacter diazotrophicus]CAP55928.1 putative DNA repair protein radC [Gluconacetobacter diazotrophicus PA1 5]